MQTLDIEAHFLASHGYVQLDMMEEAHAELDALRDVPDAAAPLTLCRIGLLTYEGRWQEAATHAANLCALERDVPDHFLLAAEIQRTLGAPGKALDILLGGPLTLCGFPAYHYQLARCFALIAETDSALDCMQHAIDLDETYRQRLQTEPDLQSIRPLLAPPDPNPESDSEGEPNSPQPRPDCPF
jgi:tetratricopeptide (TPR) repeat protein